MFISGLPGIGKTLDLGTAAAHSEAPGLFYIGKFDVYQKNIPYSSLVLALRNLVKIFLTESDDRVAYWKKDSKRVGNNGRVLTDVILNWKR